ncbi:MAG: VCBS domain-containing protein [Burkholderiales bacterium]
MTFLVNDQSTGGPIPAVAVTITENSDGSVSFALNVLGPYTGDLRGFFFDVANESRIGTLSVTPTSPGFTEFQQANDTVADLGSGANMQGLLGSDGGYDAGIEIGTAGIGSDDYQSFSFTLTSSSGPLTLEDFSDVDFGVRLTSVGEIDGSRDGAVKLLEHTSSAIDALDDADSVQEDTAPNPVGGNVFSNDLNLGTTHSVTAVNGSAANVGVDIEGTYGTLHLESDGNYSYTLDNTRAAVQALAAGQLITESFTYTATSSDEATSSSTDSAVLTITIVGTNDAPVITAAVAAGTVTELADGSPEETVGVLMASGTVDFADVDLLDLHSVSATPAAAGYLGTLSAALADASTGDGAGQVGWNFQVADGAVEHLGEGDSVTQSYTLTVDDGHGGSATQDVTITITGANDAPEIVAGDSAGEVFEDGPRRASGQLIAVDVDQNSELTWSAVGSGPMTPRADYRFLIDNLSIVRNGSQFFNDNFGAGGPPPAAPNFSGTTTPVSYGVTGGFIESGGRAIMDGSLAASVLSIGTTDPVVGNFASLLTDISADMSRGLKSDDSFRVEGRFDLVLPAEERQSYGVRLTDFLGTSGGDDIVDLVVRRGEDGIVRVHFRETDIPANTVTTLASIALDLQPGENQIVLRLSHDPANAGIVNASFDVLGGATPRTVSFTEVGHIFGNETWIRAQIAAFSPAQPQNGVYGSLSVEANGEWSYSLNNAAANVQALAQGERVTDTFTLRVTDEHGASDTKTVTIDVTGTNDTPIITGGATGGSVTEHHAPTVSGQLTAFDPDHGATLHWSANTATTLPFPGIPGAFQVFGFSSDYDFALDELTVTRNGVTIFDDGFSDGIAPPSAPNFANNTPASYGVVGGYIESGGRVHLDGAAAAGLRGVGNDNLSAGQLATLLTNNDPADLTRGLKSDDSFTVEGRFDLAVPGEGQAYGISLTDNAFGSLPPDQLGDDAVTLLVRRDSSGGLFVQFNDLDIVADTSTPLETVAFTPVPGENQIALRLIHDLANPGVVRAEFDLLGGAGGPRTLTFTQSGRIFGTGTPDYPGDDENWTRAQIVAFGPDTGGTTARGTYGSLSVQQNGEWTYSLDNGAANVQALAQNQFANDILSVRVNDEFGVSSFRAIFITVTGANDAPEITGTTTGQVYENGAARVASGQLTHGDVDQGAVVTWSLLGPAAFGGVSLDTTGRWTYSLNNGLFPVQQLAQGQTVFDSFTVRATDQHGAFDDQTVTVSVTGTGDRPNLPPTPLALSVSEDGGPVTGVTSAFDIDNGDLLHWSLNRGSSLGDFSDYEFRADSFSVSRNGVQIFHDPFDGGGAPPSAPNFGNNTTANYTTTGLFVEIDGKLVMRGDSAFAFRGTGNDALIVGNEAILVTNVDPANTVNGLKKNHQFVIEGVFDLVEPALARQAYGLTLTDGVNQIADDLLGLTVRRDPVDGQVYVQLVNNSAVLDTSTLVERDLLVAGGADQIRLRLGHEADSGDVSASYELLTGGIVIGGGSLGQAGIFGTDTPGFAGDDENWIRAGLFSNATDPNEFVQTLAGTYGTLTVDNSAINNLGQLSYTPGAAAQALAQGESAIDSFFVRAVDHRGMSSPQRVNITVTGANDAPTDIALTPGAGAVIATLSTIDPDAVDTFVYSFTSGGAGFALEGSSLVTTGGLSEGSSHSFTLRSTDPWSSFVDKPVNIVTGTSGADVFDFDNLGDGVDMVVGFAPAAGDALDIRDVLEGSATSSNIDSFVQLQESGGGTTVLVNADGAGSDFVPLASLHGVTGLLLQDLLANGNLLT